MKNNLNVPVRRQSNVSAKAQKNQFFGRFYNEATVIFFLVSFFFLAMMFTVYNSYSQAAADINYSNNRISNESKTHASGGPESDKEAVIEAVRNYNRGSLTSSVYRNGKDKSAGIQFSIFPVQGKVTDSYGGRSNPFGTRTAEFHSGLDVAAPTGTPVVAAADGIVVFSGWKGGYGNIVIIEHAGFEVATRYGHLSQRNVQVGDVVAGGTQIGYVGSTGRSTGPHLHYEIRVEGRAQNPLNFYARNR